MIHFTSNRERNLWYWTIATVLAIYLTLGLAGTLAEILWFRHLLDNIYVLSFLVMLAAMAGISIWRRPGWQEIWVVLGITAVYTMLFVRLGIEPLERTHLFEYGLVGVLIHQALLERKKNGHPSLRPALYAILTTTLIGWVDELIQAILPNRIYDIRDVLFNSLAGLMSVLASMALMWAQRKSIK